MKFLSTIKLVVILITTVLSSVGCSNTEEHAPLPVIDSFSPTSGLPGTTITINGSNFDASGPAKNLIRFKSDEALASSATKTQLTVEVPPNASTGNISVIVNNHIANSLSTFTVIQQTKPLSEYISNSSATLQSYDHNNGNPGAVGYQFSVQQDGHISALGIAAPVSGTYSTHLYNVTDKTILATIDIAHEANNNLPIAITYKNLETPVPIVKGNIYCVVYYTYTGHNLIYKFSNQYTPIAVKNTLVRKGVYGLGAPPSSYPNNLYLNEQLIGVADVIIQY